MIAAIITIALSTLLVVVMEIADRKKPKCPCTYSDYRCFSCSHKMKELRR